MKRLLPFILIVITVILYVKPYFKPGFFPTHDGEWVIVRLAEMQREIKDKQLPPRWSDYLNHGFGYPLFSFTYPGPFYIGVILRFFHIGLVDTVKMIFVGSVIFSAIFMFLLGREIAGNYAGLLSSIFYVIAPFRLVDLYVRGSIGESLSLALFPMLFYLSLKYILKPNPVRMVLCSFVLALLILSHNIMALVFFPLWLAFLYVSVFTYYEDMKLYSWRYFLPMIILGFGLSAYFFVPALLEKKYIALSQMKLTDISENFIKIPDYLISRWNYEKPSYQLGWAHILAAIVGLIGAFLAKDIYRKKYFPVAIFIITSISLLVFFAHPYSFEFWNVPPLAWIDFPWRLLTPLAFFIALASTFLSIHRNTQIIGGILLVITVLLSLGFAKPKEYINKPDDYYATNDATTTSMDELMPIWVLNKPQVRYRGSKVELGKPKGTIYNLFYNSYSIRFRVLSEKPNTILVNTVYFPGWKFFLRGEQVPLNNKDPDGLIRFNIPAGNHLIEGKFTETPVRFWSNIISLSGLIAAIILLLYSIISRFKPKSV